MSDRAIVSNTLTVSEPYRWSKNPRQHEEIIRHATDKFATIFPGTLDFVECAAVSSKSGIFIEPRIIVNASHVIRSEVTGNYHFIVPSLKFNPCVKLYVSHPTEGFVTRITQDELSSIRNTLKEVFGDDVESLVYRYCAHNRRRTTAWC